jgi:1-deoxy-D-xylulose-5-phosphate synthase
VEEHDMRVLDRVNGPADLRRLEPGQLAQLAREVREFLVASVCRTGGHLGPNLGVVELTFALHRVFDSPTEPIVFDTGHQSYVHKIVTGRRDGFGLLRSGAGLSGYPNRAESVHDVAENSHASTALSYADGLSKSFVAAGAADRPVVAVIGDGALTGGLAWEALNNLGRSGRHVVVVLNDNGHSYSPTAGALPRHLERLVDRPGYADVQALLGGDRRVTDPEPTGRRSVTSWRRTDGGLFESLGFTYLGPVDGHDVVAIEERLRAARETPGPVLVHCRTEKGRGYRPAVEDMSDHLHTVGVVDVCTGKPAQPPAPTWTDAFAEALLEVGGERRDVVAISAAMLGPTGLQRFADRFPGRCHDVGIAEQHALTSAAGMAMGGLHPVVALYATFANRAFDQTLLDVGLHRLPVTLVLDRAGVTGPDGPSHHGMWDLVMLGIVPGMRVAAPRDAQSLAEELREAVDVAGPTAVRFPKAKLGSALPAVRRVGEVDVLRDGEDVLVVAVGAMAGAALEAAEVVDDSGISCTVVDPRWVLPVSEELVDLAAEHRLVVTVEDGVRVGGVGSHLTSALSDRGVDVPVCCLGLAGAYLRHGSRAELLAAQGLDSAGLCASVQEAWSRVGGTATPLSLVATADEEPLPGRSTG